MEGLPCIQGAAGVCKACVSVPTLCMGTCGASIHELHSGATLAQGLRRAVHKELAFKLLLFFIFLFPPPTLFSF